VLIFLLFTIRYDPPTEMTEYVHRIGRTARKGCAGSAILMLRPCEAGYVQLLHNNMGVKMVELSKHLLLDGLCETHHGRRGSSKRIEISRKLQTQMTTLIERLIDNDQELMEEAGNAFHTSIRAYACHSKESKPYFNIRRLHLGHVAKSFGLKNPPSKIKRVEKKQENNGPRGSSGSSSKAGSPSINIQATGIDIPGRRKLKAYEVGDKFASSEFGS
jgi:ATP-dependent RNA helicase DDX31/DBP7